MMRVEPQQQKPLGNWPSQPNVRSVTLGRTNVRSALAGRRNPVQAAGGFPP
jgi:hypothetical protein